MSFISCGDCEDKTLEVNDNLLNWLPYTTETDISFANPNTNQTLNFTISPDVTIKMEPDGDCETTIVQPFIDMQNEELNEFMHIWLNPNEDFLLGKRDQLWAIIRDEGELQESGAITDINAPDLLSTAIILDGNTFEDVVVLSLNDDIANTTEIYLQKNVGIIGYIYNTDLWIAN